MLRLMLGVGLGAYVFSIALLWQFKDEIVRVPIGLEVGATADTGEFPVTSEGAYIIALELDRALDAALLDCLINDGAVSSGAVDCGPIKPVVDTEWKIYAAAELVSEGSSDSYHGSFWGKNVARSIGEFAAQKNAHYRVKVESRSDLSALALAKPRIVVRHRSPRVETAKFAANCLQWFAAIAIGSCAFRFLFERMKLLRRD